MTTELERRWQRSKANVDRDIEGKLPPTEHDEVKQARITLSDLVTGLGTIANDETSSADELRSFALHVLSTLRQVRH